MLLLHQRLLLRREAQDARGVCMCVCARACYDYTHPLCNPGSLSTEHNRQHMLHIDMCYRVMSHALCHDMCMSIMQPDGGYLDQVRTVDSEI